MKDAARYGRDDLVLAFAAGMATTTLVVFAAIELAGRPIPWIGWFIAGAMLAGTAVAFAGNRLAEWKENEMRKAGEGD